MKVGSTYLFLGGTWELGHIRFYHHTKYFGDSILELRKEEAAMVFQKTNHYS